MGNIGKIEVKIDDFKDVDLSWFGLNLGKRNKIEHMSLTLENIEELPFIPASISLPPLVEQVSCEHRREDCIEPREKCKECGNNKAKSYFKAKEEVKTE